jgi:hypothetical protein
MDRRAQAWLFLVGALIGAVLGLEVGFAAWGVSGGPC